ncbi:glycosyltransferase [Burkholderia sp. Ax-1719]|uniref:glycosyltransferase n=1 Tax=Burkholderia sp. Ax-1719 TaxID=2608334 RepID=UPI00142290D3|nr:glycosyltransferase [Burkholderia sp. Ax-1719]NIE65482.1 glycosyltransferase [Burkholderia sp. Ax-1719]
MSDEVTRGGAGASGESVEQRLARSEGELAAARRALEASEGELALVREALERARQVEHDTEQECRALQERLDAANDDLEQEAEALRIAHDDVRRIKAEVQALLGSTSWRLMAPMRLAITTFRTPRAIVVQAKQVSGTLRYAIGQYGLAGTFRKAMAAARRRGITGLLGSNAPGGGLKPVLKLPQALPARDRLALRVLIIGEMSIPQCRKYRVTQKQQMILQRGIDCTVANWTEFEHCRSLLQTHSVVFFYRVPGFPEPLRLIEEARALGLPTFWEVDDLIFDAQEYSGNSNLADLNEETRRGVLDGVALYRKAMLACDAGIASTVGLADAMRRAGLRDVHVVENALDKETQRVARKITTQPRRRDGIVRIVYGSGTKTHDADFRVAAPAIKRVMKERPDVHLVVVGELNLPPDYLDIQAQIERLPLSDYPTYLKRLASCDISIAPLEDSVFNDAKSNIKFLEASIVRLPSVCSPSAAFRTAIRHGETGYLAADSAAWEASLLALVDDAALRESMANAAYAYVNQHYAPNAVAQEQVEPILEPFKLKRRKMRVLAVNIYFEPRSFGGATVVAEEIARRLNQREDIEYAMFTSLPTSDVPGYRLTRYGAAGGDAFGMGLPHEPNPNFEFENPNSVAAFADAVSALRPDVVHLHSIQGIGAQIAEVCLRERIPFVVTLHDAWWICGRQFMITGDNQYCYQRKIDLNVCATCVDDASRNTYRQFRLREILLSASRLVAPSAFFKDLYAQNGFDAGKIVVNKNGIRAPQRDIRREPPGGRPLRFGYVGGETQIKGAPLIRKALRSLSYNNYELHVVDNVLNLGRHSIDARLWAIPGVLKIQPAYTQETIDSFFANIDVLLFPTQWKESFGLTVREALIRDVWVIATDAGGVIEDIVPGENGDIIPLDDDGTELAAAIARLLANPQRLDGYRNAHKGMIRLFEEQAVELHALFGEVVAEAKAANAAHDADRAHMNGA